MFAVPDLVCQSYFKNSCSWGGFSASVPGLNKSEEMKPGKEMKIRVIYGVCCPLTEAQQNYKATPASVTVLITVSEFLTGQDFCVGFVSHTMGLLILYLKMKPGRK